ncbi:helix-turn-helix domain-containing protein [Puniceicoccus vermicola]|nr:helix-turn-helix domain-containing protein [Puniceicoccus vermicola]
MEPSEKKNLIGGNLRRMRMERGSTQQGLASECAARGWDLSRAGLSKIEAGIRRVNDAELLLLSDILKLPLGAFFGLSEGASDQEKEEAATAAISVARHGRD